MIKFSKALLKTKLKASALHLSLSLIIFFILVYKIYYVWYPQPYFSIDGGWQGIRIIAAVDLVLGPLITFLIFDLSKTRRAIMFDIITIAVIQIGALIYGVVTTYEQRPVAIVLSDEFFVPVTPGEYGSQLKSVTELSKYSDEIPPIIASEIALNREALDEVLKINKEQEIAIHAQIQLYQPRENLSDSLKKRQVNTLKLLELSKGEERYEQWLKRNNKKADDVLLGVFNGRYGRIWLLFDQSANYIGYFK